jgi:hypothetical protein
MTDAEEAAMTQQQFISIIVVVTIALAAFIAGRLSSNLQPFDSTAFERAYTSCVESTALEYRDKIKAEFRQAEQEWEAKHTRYQWPVHAAVYRSFERPDLEGYIERVAPTRVDYPAYNERRIECARQTLAR